MKTFLAVVFLLGVVLACGGPEPPPPSLPSDILPADEHPVDPPIELPLNAHQRLARGLRLALAVDESSIAARIANEQDETGAQSSFTEGAMRVRVAGEVLSSPGVSLVVPDIEIGAERFPPHGLHLADLSGSLSLSEVALTSEAPEGPYTFEGTATFRLEWSLVGQGGEKLPIRPLVIDEVPVNGELSVNEADRARLVLRFYAPGPVFDAGLAQMFDLSLVLVLME